MEKDLTLEELNAHCMKMGIYQNENTLLTRAIATALLAKGIISNVELQSAVDDLLAEAEADLEKAKESAK